MIRSRLILAQKFREGFVAEIKVLDDALEQRFLPAFKNIKEEANEVAKKAFERMGQVPSADGDPGDYAEDAWDEGVDHYVKLDSLRQGFLNLYAVFCYHSFEQQFFRFYDWQRWGPSDEADRNLLNWEDACKWIGVEGIELERFETWPKIKELRILANVAKHAEGRSADELRKVRPDMLIPPGSRLQEQDMDDVVKRLRVAQPLSGEGLYMGVEELSSYIRALIAFWNDMADELERQEKERNKGV
jgi:hypothetical protein